MEASLLQSPLSVRTWRVGKRRELALACVPGGVPTLAAIVNVTPDSFADGGRWSPAVSDCPAVDPSFTSMLAQWLADGVQVIDLGGESTRPGAQAIEPSQEWQRLGAYQAAVLDQAQQPFVLSIDTRWAVTAERALLAGAHVINDVSGLADPGMAEVIARHRAGVIVGHMRGVPATMQHCTDYSDLLADIADELARACERALAAGIDRQAIVIDPGLGFAKTPEQSAALLSTAGWFERVLDYPVMIGASRKRFLGEATGRAVHEREVASAVASVLAAQGGARLLRVHDVRASVDALAVLAYSQRSAKRWPPPSRSTSRGER